MDFRPHRVADGVVTVDKSVLETADLVVLSQHTESGPEILKVGLRFSFLRLHENCANRLGPHVSPIDVAGGQCDLRIRLFGVDRDDKVIGDRHSVVAMVVARALALRVAFQTIASVEKLADVSAYVGLNHKAATGMLSYKISDIEHKFVQNEQFAALLYLLVDVVL